LIHAKNKRARGQAIAQKRGRERKSFEGGKIEGLGRFSNMAETEVCKKRIRKPLRQRFQSRGRKREQDQNEDQKKRD